MSKTSIFFLLSLFFLSPIQAQIQKGDFILSGYFDFDTYHRGGRLIPTTGGHWALYKSYRFFHETKPTYLVNDWLSFGIGLELDLRYSPESESVRVQEDNPSEILRRIEYKSDDKSFRYSISMQNYFIRRNNFTAFWEVEYSLEENKSYDMITDIFDPENTVSDNIGDVEREYSRAYWANLRVHLIWHFHKNWGLQATWFLLEYTPKQEYRQSTGFKFVFNPNSFRVGFVRKISFKGFNQANK